MPRTIAIGDIHGCAVALDTVLNAVRARPDDTIVTLGDYIDRGIDSKGVIDRLIALRDECQLVSLLGNHDRMLLDLLDKKKGSKLSREIWLSCGGVATLQSYGDLEKPREIPAEHVAFLRSCRLFWETDTHFFVHANYLAERPLAGQSEAVLIWESLREVVPLPHGSGKTAIVGHSSQKSGEILDLGHVKCIDTYCYGGKWLTALDVDSGRVWQASESGRLRH